MIWWSMVGPMTIPLFSGDTDGPETSNPVRGSGTR